MKIYLYDRPILDYSYIGRHVKDENVVENIGDYLIHQYKIIEYDNSLSFINEICDNDGMPEIHGFYENTGIEYARGFDPFEIMEEVELFLQHEYPEIPITFPSRRPIELIKSLDIKVVWYKNFPDLSGFTKEHEVKKKALKILRDNEIYWEWDLQRTALVALEILDALFSESHTYYFYENSYSKIMLSKYKEGELLKHMNNAVDKAES